MRTTGQKFNGMENHSITRAAVNVFVENYRKTAAPDAIFGGLFSKKDVLSVLDQSDAVGMRYYYALNSENEEMLVLCGTDENRNDILDNHLLKAAVIHPPLDGQKAIIADLQQPVSLSTAGEKTYRYRQAAGLGALKGGFFGAMAVRKILDQGNCEGLRYYFGREENGRRVIILLGINAHGHDMLEGVYAEYSYPCPPFCAEKNPLNNDRLFLQYTKVNKTEAMPATL